MEQLLGALAGFLFVILGIVIAIYIITALWKRNSNGVDTNIRYIFAWETNCE